METVELLLKLLQATYSRKDGVSFELPDVGGRISVVRGMVWFEHAGTELAVPLDDERLAEWTEAYCKGREFFGEHIMVFDQK